MAADPASPHRHPHMNRYESIRHGLLLVLPLILLFPKTFSENEMISAGDQAAVLAPWFHSVPVGEAREAKNGLTIDSLLVFHAQYEMARDALLAGEWPLWNHYQYGGMPLLANAQSAVFYPPRLLHAVFDVTLATTFYMLLKLWLCGMTAFICGRALGLDLSVARLLSFAWLMSSYVLVWAYHPLPEVAAWLPILFLGAEWLLLGKVRNGFFAMAFAATLMLLAGHPETAFTGALGVGIYFVLRLAVERRTGRILIVPPLAALGAWALALTVTAVQLLPLIEYILNSYDYAARGAGDRPTHALPLAALAVLFVPRFFGVFAEETWWADFGGLWTDLNSNWVNMIYPGTVVWAGILLFRFKHGADSALRSRIGCLFATCVLLSLFAFRPSPLAFVTQLPILNATHHVYHLTFVMFALPLAGAFGYQQWLRRTENHHESRRIWAAGAVAIAAVLALGLFYRESIQEEGVWPYFAGQIGIALALWAACGYLLRRRPGTAQRRRAIVLLTAVLFVDLYLPVRHLHPTMDRRFILHDTELTRVLQDLEDPVRVRSKTGHLWEGMLQPFGIEQWLGYDGLYPARTMALDEALPTDIGDPLHPLLGVGYYLAMPESAPSFLNENNERFEVVGEWEGLRLYRDREALPRAYFVNSVKVVENSDEIFANLNDPEFNARTTALVQEPVPGFDSRDVRVAPGDVRFASRSNNSSTWTTSSDESSVMVLTETYFPGWRVTIDDEPAELFPVYHAFRGVAVPAGQHTVRFEYRPSSFAWGLRISVAALVFAAAAAIVLIRRTRTSRRTVQGSLFPPPVVEWWRRGPAFAPKMAGLGFTVPRLREIAIHSVLLVVPLIILFPGTFFRGEMIAPGDHLLSQPPWAFYGRDEPVYDTNPLIFEALVTFNVNYVLAKESIREGLWPLWNHLQYGGMPLLANAQSAVFYPIRLLHSLLDVYVATTIQILLKIWLCGMTAYLAARGIGLRIAPARFVSIAWMLSSCNLIWAYHPIPDVNAWLPLFFLAVEYLLAGKYRKGFFLFVPVASIMLFAGHPETAYMTCFGTGVYFLLRLVWDRRTGARLAIPAGLAAAGWALALGIAAVQILPLLEYISVSWNVANRINEHPTRFYFPAETAPALFAPRFFGTYTGGNYWGPWPELNSNWVGMAFSGVALWVIAGLAIPLRKRRGGLGSRPVCLIIAGLLSLLAAYQAPGASMVKQLPFMGEGYLLYHVMFFSFALAMLCGVLLDRWTAARLAFFDLRASAAAAAGIGIFLLWSFFKWRPLLQSSELQDQVEPSFIAFQCVVAVSFALGALCVLALFVKWPRPRLWITVLTLLLAGDLLFAVRDLRATIPRTYLFRETPLTTHLQRLPRPARIGVSDSGIVEGYMQVYGIEQWRGYDGIYPERIRRLDIILSDENWDAVEPLFGIHSYLSIMADPLNLPGWGTPLYPLEIVLDGVGVYRNTGGLPRAFLLSEHRVHETKEDVLDVMVKGDFNPRQTALLEAGTTNLPPSTDGDAGSAHVVRRQAQRIEIQSNAEREAILVVLDSFYPGWTAAIDGEPAEIFPVDYAFRGVVVPEGLHDVVLEYRPRSFYTGLWISTGSLMLAFVVGCVTFVRMRKRTEAPGS